MKLELTFSAVRRGRRTIIGADSIRLPDGNGIGVLGLNGAGKSTFLMAAAGLLRGADLVLNGVPAAQTRIAYAPQNSPLPPWLAVRDVFKLYGSTPSAAANLFPGLRLEEIERLKVRNLTPGQKQTLVLAVTLVTTADVLVLDEPFTGLDHHRRSAVLAKLADAAAERTVIVSAQSIADILGFCDRFVILRDGSIVFAGHLHDFDVPVDATPADFDRKVLDLVLGTRLKVST